MAAVEINGTRERARDICADAINLARLTDGARGELGEFVLFTKNLKFFLPKHVENYDYF